MRSGIDRSAMDEQVRPQDDLYGYVNGGWLSRTQIPADRGRYGTFDLLHDRSLEAMHELLEEQGDDQGAGARARHLYGLFMDEAKVESSGLDPVRDVLAEVDGVTDGRSAMVLLGRLQRESIRGLVLPFVSTDDKQPDRYVIYLEQAGLRLPDEAYYREEQYADIRSAYVAHVERLLTLGGAQESEAKAAAQAVMDLETRLAKGHWDRVTCRDAVKTYTMTDLAGLEERAPGVPWREWLTGLGAPEFAWDSIVVRQPSFLETMARELAETDGAVWRGWLRVAVLTAYAPYLHDALVQERFDFYGRTLSGTPEMLPRWKRGVSLVDGLVGEDAGQLYVARHFPAKAKARMTELVANLVEAYRQDISQLDWMTPATREKALEKLSTFAPKVGHPDEWRDYSALTLPDDLVGAVRAGTAFETDRQLGHLGQPIDRGEWHMSPQTVNAYYNPGLNEIVFPAAILQPPFFDVEADDAVNYGAIGAVIGHEIGHGFDDQGSRYDGTGALVDWWTQEDRDAFEVKTKALIGQYDGFSPRALPDEHVNGGLTVGENIGDLGGVTIAHKAYRLAIGDGEAPELDGLTGDQRFFAGWAAIWGMLARPEEAKRLLSIDPHSPGEFRANIVRNLHEFYEAFDVTEGDGLWLPEDQRVRIW